MNSSAFYSLQDVEIPTPEDALTAAEDNDTVADFIDVYFMQVSSHKGNQNNFEPEKLEQREK